MSVISTTFNVGALACLVQAVLGSVSMKCDIPIFENSVTCTCQNTDEITVLWSVNDGDFTNECTISHDCVNNPPNYTFTNLKINDTLYEYSLTVINYSYANCAKYSCSNNANLRDNSSEDLSIIAIDWDRRYNLSEPDMGDKSGNISVTLECSFPHTDFTSSWYTVLDNTTEPFSPKRNGSDPVDSPCDTCGQEMAKQMLIWMEHEDEAGAEDTVEVQFKLEIRHTSDPARSIPLTTKQKYKIKISDTQECCCPCLGLEECWACALVIFAICIACLYVVERCVCAVCECVCPSKEKAECRICCLMVILPLMWLCVRYCRCCQQNKRVNNTLANRNLSVNDTKEEETLSVDESQLGLNSSKEDIKKTITSSVGESQDQTLSVDDTDEQETSSEDKSQEDRNSHSDDQQEDKNSIVADTQEDETSSVDDRQGHQTSSVDDRQGHQTSSVDDRQGHQNSSVDYRQGHQTSSVDDREMKKTERTRKKDLERSLAKTPIVPRDSGAAYNEAWNRAPPLPRIPSKAENDVNLHGRTTVRQHKTNNRKSEQSDDADGQ